MLEAVGAGLVDASARGTLALDWLRAAPVTDLDLWQRSRPRPCVLTTPT
jgi:hypothetical protein